jgi:hypothetical protein
MSSELRLTSLMLFLSFVFLTALTQAQNLIDNPESVAFDSLRNRYLVSNIGDGAVVAVDTGGAQEIFMSGFGACFGNCMYGDTLFLSNGTHVYGIDLSTEEIFMDMPMPPASRSYDGMTTDTSGNLYVVYTDGMIYKIQISQQILSAFVYVGLAPYTQDIIFDARENRLLAAGYSQSAPIQAISLADSTVVDLVYTTFGYMDGITMDHAGNVYVSCSTGGRVYRYDRSFTNPPELISSGHNQPAGLDYNFRDNILAVPNFARSTVDFIPISFSPKVESYALEDVSGGDGDGIFESGETVGLTFSVINYRSQPISDVTVSLSCDDAMITIVDGSTYLGAMASMDTLDNAGDPLQFAIPADYYPRVDSLILEIIFNGGTEVERYVIQRGLGTPNILLIDDDDGDNIEDYYIECLMAERIPWAIVSTPPAPTAALLSEYELVIWFTGDYRPPIEAEDIAAIQEYLDGGGKLFITGQGIAAQLAQTDPDFLNNYLKADYLSTSLVPVLGNVSSGPIFDLVDSVYITGSGGAYNQTAPDHLAAVNGGVGELAYIGGADLGAVSYSGDYTCLFFGFGFEGIINGNSRWTDRYVIFSKILDFFDYQRPGVSPEIADLHLVGEDIGHVINHAFDMSWSYSDAGLSPQVYYQVQVGTDDNWLAAEMWDSGPVAGSETQTEYAGSLLEDGSTYYLRGRASNGALWSPWLYLVIRMNSVPTPSDLTPDDLQEATEGQFALTHSNVPDNEGDVITYGYEIYDDESLTILTDSVSGHAAGTEATSSWLPQADMTVGEDYYWRVRADDGFEPGEWSETASFVVLAAYVCGDANGDDMANVADAVFLINYVFKGGPAPEILEAGNVNCDADVNVADAVYLINYVFKGGAEPCEACP